jgi:hypothetical protein
MHRLMHGEAAKCLDRGSIATSCIKGWFSAFIPRRRQPHWVDYGRSAFGDEGADSRHCAAPLPFPKTMVKRENFRSLINGPAAA